MQALTEAAVDQVNVLLGPHLLTMGVEQPMVPHDSPQGVFCGVRVLCCVCFALYMGVYVCFVLSYQGCAHAAANVPNLPNLHTLYCG